MLIKLFKLNQLSVTIVFLFYGFLSPPVLEHLFKSEIYNVSIVIPGIPEKKIEIGTGYDRPDEHI